MQENFRNGNENKIMLLIGKLIGCYSFDGNTKYFWQMKNVIINPLLRKELR
jgi:hypothetical protein